VNPTHLYLGTKKNNAEDRENRSRGNHATGLRHGRHTHPGQTAGSGNGRAKMDEKTIQRLLREHFEQGRRKADLARDYGLSKTTVGHIVSGKLWPNVEGRVAQSQSSSN
jgi:DNA-binding XRE family transcriptional regulator